MTELLERSVETDRNASRDYLFGNIISQLVPDEARILAALSDGRRVRRDRRRREATRAASTARPCSPTRPRSDAAAGVVTSRQRADLPHPPARLRSGRIRAARRTSPGRPVRHPRPPMPASRRRGDASRHASSGRRGWCARRVHDRPPFGQRVLGATDPSATAAAPDRRADVAAASLHDIAEHWYIDLSIPVVAAIIGYVTKLVAIRMMFQPIEFVGIQALPRLAGHRAAAGRPDGEHRRRHHDPRPHLGQRGGRAPRPRTRSPRRSPSRCARPAKRSPARSWLEYQPGALGRDARADAHA